MRNGSILIMAVSMMDFITSIFILIYPHPLLVARLGIFYEIFPVPYAGAILMLCAVFLAAVGLSRPNGMKWKFIYFLPQHLFLLLTTGSAINAIIAAHYADGVIRPWQFIFQDQLPIIILTIFYAYAIFDWEKKD